MRAFICFLGGILVFGFLTSIPCHSTESSKQEITYPEGDIQELRIDGMYEPEDPQRLEKLKEFLKDYLKPGETVEERYPHFMDIGDEKFGEHPRFDFCYDKTPEGKKEPVFNKNLRVRLYDNKENVIAEDYLRVSYFDKENNLYSTVSYIPYLKKGHFFRVVRLENEKEVVLWKPGIRGTAIISKAQLIRWPETTRYAFGSSYKYHPETKCHHDNFHIR